MDSYRDYASAPPAGAGREHLINSLLALSRQSLLHIPGLSAHLQTLIDYRINQSRMKHSLLALCLLFTGVTASAQRVENIRSEINGEDITIIYDLVAARSGQVFAISIYSSHNDYSDPLSEVSGDVGDDITTGNNKVIVWQARKELGPYRGTLTFEIRAKVIYNPISIISPEAGETFKGGKSLEIRWDGGTATDQVTVQLLKGNQVYSEITANSTNDGMENWPVPAKIEKNSTFKVRISSTNPHASPVESGFFTLKKKGSPVVPLVLLGLAGGGAAFFLGGDSTPTDDSLPEAPGPPGN